MFMWLAMLFGTAVLSAMGLVLLVLVARSESNRMSSVPLVLRTVVAVMVVAWGFLMGGAGHGVGFAVLPSAYIFGSLLADTQIEAAGVALFGGQLSLFAIIFVWLSRRTRLSSTVPALRIWREALAATCICLVGFGVPALIELAKPCEHTLNGVCYDMPNAGRTPLAFDLQLINPETQAPIANGWVSMSWQQPQRNTRALCSQESYAKLDSSGRVHFQASNGNWIPGDVRVVVPGFEPANLLISTEPNLVELQIEFPADQRTIFAAWVQRASELGYTLKNGSDQIYAKQLGSPSSRDRRRLAQSGYEPDGALRYWVSNRSLPTTTTYSIERWAYCQDPEIAASIEEKAARKLFNKAWFARPAFLICDKSWDYVVANATTNARELANLSLYLIDEEKEQNRVREALKDFFSTSGDQSLRVLTSQERKTFCEALAPYVPGELRHALEQPPTSQ